jgi:hypothetical protein
MSFGIRREPGSGAGAPMSGRTNGKWWRDTRNEHARSKGWGRTRPKGSSGRDPRGPKKSGSGWW